MRINRREHPRVQVMYDVDGAIHLVSPLTGTWCGDEAVEIDGPTPLPENPDGEMCRACYESGVAEGAIIP